MPSAPILDAERRFAQIDVNVRPSESSPTRLKVGFTFDVTDAAVLTPDGVVPFPPVPEGADPNALLDPEFRLEMN